MIVPKGSMDSIGFRVSRPAFLAVGSPEPKRGIAMRELVDRDRRDEEHQPKRCLDTEVRAHAGSFRGSMSPARPASRLQIREFGLAADRTTVQAVVQGSRQYSREGLRRRRTQLDEIRTRDRHPRTREHAHEALDPRSRAPSFPRAHRFTIASAGSELSRR